MHKLFDSHKDIPVCLFFCFVVLVVVAGPASIKCAGQGNKPPYPAGGMGK